MAQRKPNKQITFLEPSFKDVLVCAKENTAPYIQIFHEEPENITRKKMGILLGVFEITDGSEESSYIVNYLISVIKKEYYSLPKRGSIESFESALHKANLALSKLASHGNINWIGKLNAVCAIIEKNHIHIAQTGSAAAYLVRSGNMADISSKEEETAELHPLKTFEDVLSGRLLKDDKVIIATESIFEIFSEEEIKKSALKFTEEKFVRFLKTALSSELERSAVLVVDVKEKEKAPVPQRSALTESINAFSQNAFAKKPSRNNLEAPAKNNEIPEKKEIVGEIQKDYQKTKGGFVDEKTGHIYIKEDSAPQEEKRSFFETMEECKYKALDVLEDAGETVRTLSGSAFSKFKKIGTGNKTTSENAAVRAQKAESPKNEQGFFERFSGLRDRCFHAAYRKIQLGFDFFGRMDFSGFWNSAKERYGKMEFKDNLSFDKFTPSEEKKRAVWENFKNVERSAKALASDKKFFVPLLALILIATASFAFFSPRPEEKKPEPQNTAQVKAANAPLENDKNLKRIRILETVLSGSSVLKLLNLNGKILAVGEEKIMDLEERREYELPADFRNPKISFVMDNLNLVFLLNRENKIVSFSPVSAKFQENDFVLPENAQIIQAGSYLTYGYFLDERGGQIYRYPRAGNGFGEKTDWLKDSTGLASANGMAINGDIYLAGSGKIAKLSRGKKENFQMEETATPIIADGVYAEYESPNIYVLDKNNSRIVQLGISGNIIAQYYNSEVTGAEDFAVNETKGEIFFSTGNEIKKFEIKK